MRRSRRMIVSLIPVIMLSCAPESAPMPIAGEHQGEPPELAFAGSSIAATFDHDGQWAASSWLEAPEGATRAGFLVDFKIGVDPTSLGIQVQGEDADGNDTAWMPAEVTWTETPYAVIRADFGAMVVRARFRLPQALEGIVAYVTWAAVQPEPEPEGGVAQVQGALSSDLSGLVNPRSAWKARATKCTGQDGGKYRMAIHHTFTPPAASGSFEARLRSIQAYHMDTRGWCDIGYHFLVTTDGQVWEGRPLQYIGAHVANSNSGNVGISLVGCFQPGGCDVDGGGGAMQPSEALLQGTAAIVQAIANKYGIAVGSSTVKPHRGHPGASTDCPGDSVVSRLPDIYAMAKGGAAAPAPAPNPAPAPAPKPVAGTGKLVGVVWDVTVTPSPATAGNVRIPGATITANGVTKTSRAGDAYWELPLPAGSWTVTASAPGYATTSIQVDVAAGGETWGSIGLAPAAPSGQVTVQVTHATSDGPPVSDAFVYVPGLGVVTTGPDGRAVVNVGGGSAKASIYRAGYKAGSVTLNAWSPTASVALTPAKPLSSGTGRLQGVVWDATVTESPSDYGNVRVDDAILICSCGQAVRARDGDAFWMFDTLPGTYTVTAVAPGYAETKRTLTVNAWGEEWGSIGVAPQ